MELSPWKTNTCSAGQKIRPLCRNPEGAKPYSQEYTTALYPQRPNECSHPNTLFFKIHFSFPSTLRSFKRSFPWLFPIEIFVISQRATMYNFMKETYTLSLWSIHWSRLIISLVLSSPAVLTCHHAFLKSAVVLQYLSVTPPPPTNGHHPFQCPLNCLSFGSGISMSCMKQAE